MVHHDSSPFYKIIIYHLNTSYVMVHPEPTFRIVRSNVNLNTSYVMVHPNSVAEITVPSTYLNTSYVMVHQ